MKGGARENLTLKIQLQKTGNRANFPAIPNEK